MGGPVLDSGPPGEETQALGLGPEDLGPVGVDVASGAHTRQAQREDLDLPLHAVPSLGAWRPWSSSSCSRRVSPATVQRGGQAGAGSDGGGRRELVRKWKH